jgi:hypothetical protein
MKMAVPLGVTALVPISPVPGVLANSPTTKTMGCNKKFFRLNKNHCHFLRMLAWVIFALVIYVLWKAGGPVHLYQFLKTAYTPPPNYDIPAHSFIPEGKIKKVAVIGAGSSGLTSPLFSKFRY